MRTGIMIGTGNAFLGQRFSFARQVQHYRCNYCTFGREVTRASRAVMFVTTKTLKNVLKPQWTYPTCIHTVQHMCGGLNLYCGCSCVCFIISVLFMLGVLQISHGSNLYSKNSYLCDSFVSVSLLVVFHLHCT